MKRLLSSLSLTFVFAASLLSAAEPPAPAALDELSALIRSNLAGVTGAELNQAAVKGVLDHFKGRVVLGELKPGAGTGALVSRSARYDESFALVRLSRVDKGAATRVKSAIAALSSNAPLKGLVLDLRYAAGGDYQAAAQVADLFAAQAQPLLDWGAGRAAAKAKKNAITLPLAVLVNGQTRGAAEALAASLRRVTGALLIGSATAGEAALYQKFTLAGGQTVHIAGGQIKVGTEVLPTGGVRPDIAISVGAKDERAWFADPFKEIAVQVASTTAAATAPPPRRRINEAELVRRQREGFAPDDPFDASPEAEAPKKPLVRDPALARALDVLKALAIVQPRPQN
jgi:hypothetical protein